MNVVIVKPDATVTDAAREAALQLYSGTHPRLSKVLERRVSPQGNCSAALRRQMSPKHQRAAPSRVTRTKTAFYSH